jgi:hypothetical protein
MSTKDKYLEAIQRADARDAARAAKKDRAQKRAQARTQAASVPAQSLSPSVQTSRSDTSVPEPALSGQMESAQVEETQPQTKPRVCICHGTNPVESYGLCKKSVDSLRFTRPPKLPSDVVGVFRERAELVAWKVRPAKTKYQLTAEKMAEPEVADYVAANVIQKGMDYEAGVAAALPELKDKPAELGPAINAAKQSPMVQAAITDSLKKKGLDQDSRDYYVQKMWKWLESTNPSEERRQLQAARLLGEHFLKNMPPSADVTKLEIVGIESGLQKMFGDDYEKVKNLKPVAATAVIDETELEEDEIGEDQ